MRSPALRFGSLMAAAAVVPALLLAGAGPAAAADNAVVQHEVTFTVKNVNSTSVACTADGGTYQIHGHLTAPVQDLSAPGAVTLVLHGLSYGEFFADYNEQDGYNFAELEAQAGHAVVTVDRLGYGASDQPPGTGICFGSQATMAHQMVADLRSGQYTLDGASAPAFPQVVLAGHSVGGLITQIEAYTFHDIDGAMILSYSDTVVSLAAQAALGIAVQQCQAGGTLKDGDHGAKGYIYFGADTPAKFIEAHFFVPGADATVVNTVASLRSRDPCGDVLSYQAAVKADMAGVSRITAPALVMVGGQDAIYPTAATTQAGLLTGDSDVKAVTIPQTGHALFLHLSAPLVRTTIATWLVDHHFGGSVMPTGAADTGGGSAPGRSTTTLAESGAVLLFFGALVWIVGQRRRSAGADSHAR